MNLNPQDIQQQKFKKRFRGFDVKEVDSFLNDVADNFLAILHENKRLQERVDELEHMREQHLAEEKDMKAAILSAQRTTDELQKKSELETADYQAKLKDFEEEIQGKRDALEEEKKKNQSEADALIAKTKEEMKALQQAMDEEFAKTKADREKSLQVLDEKFAEAKEQREKSLKEVETSIIKTREDVKSLQEEITRLTTNRDETLAELEKSGQTLAKSNEELEEIKKNKAKVTEELRAILTKYLQLLEPAQTVEPLGEELFDDSLDIIFETEEGETLEQGLDENILMELFQGVELSNEADIAGRSEEGEEDLTDLYESIKLPDMVDDKAQNTIQELSEDLLFSGDDHVAIEDGPSVNQSPEANQKPPEKHD